MSATEKMEHAVKDLWPKVVASLEDKLLAAVQAHMDAASPSATDSSSSSSSSSTTPRPAHSSTTTEPQVSSSSAPEEDPARAPPPLPPAAPGSGPASVPFPSPDPAPHPSHALSPPPSSFTLVHRLPVSSSSLSSSMDDSRVVSGSTTLNSSSAVPGHPPAPESVPTSVLDLAPAPKPAPVPVVDGPPPATPAKERVSMFSPGERDVTDARMMPAPGPTPAPRPLSQYPTIQVSVSPNSPYPYPYPQTQIPYAYNANGPPPPRPPHSRRQSHVDWIVPTTRPDTATRDTVKHRLGFTIDIAKKRHSSLESHAKLVGRALNGAIGLQIVVGALITGLAAVTTGRQTSIMTSILGALSTIIGSYLARMRGTGEPDLSKSRAKGWEKFLRSCEAYIVDHGDEPAREHMERINEFRQEFENLEGSANAEQKGNNV